MKLKELYRFINDGKVVQELDLEEWQCAGISGKQSINEACGGCVGCLLAQAIYAGWREEKTEEIQGQTVITMKYEMEDPYAHMTEEEFDNHPRSKYYNGVK